MNPLLTEAVTRARHHPDPELREMIPYVVQALAQLPALIAAQGAPPAPPLAPRLPLDPGSFDNSHRLATGLCDRGDFLLALPLALYGASFQPECAGHHFLVGACLQRLEQAAAAAHYYRTALQLDERDAASAYRLGECLEALDRYDDARHLYHWVIELARGDFGLRKLQDMASGRLQRLQGR